MRFSVALVAAAVSALASAAPSSNAAEHVVHEKRDVQSSQWLKRARLPADFPIPVRVGLKQRNVEDGERFLMDVSDPQSENYGKHWTPSRVHDFFSPSEETIETVKEWLIAAGIPASGVRHSSSHGWLEFKASASEVESLLGTEYYLYDHESNDRSHIACEEYRVPAHISPHLDFITPSVHFDIPEKPSDFNLRKRKFDRRAAPGIWTGPKQGNPVNVGQIAASGLGECYYAGGSGHNSTSLGIVEYAPQSFLQSDLENFWVTPVLNDAGVPKGTAPKLVRIDGGELLTEKNNTGDYEGEPNLDLEYAMALVYPQEVTLYQVGDIHGKQGGYASFGNFLDALDGDYCTYKGGDDPRYDEQFPDKGGYNHPEDCGTAPLTAVISTSYGYNELDLGHRYQRRQCHEYMKLGLMGTSFLFSSGDYGVGGNGGQCIAKNGSYNHGVSGRFNPSFPSTCPWVTSVGATQIPRGSDVTKPESACETVIYSGGGFSNVYPMPQYQKAAVQSYYQQHAPPYGANRYNNSQTVRGYPDVSANGARYVVALDGSYVQLYGTSASAPVVASIVTLLNEKRVAAGKSTLGFLNPVFYANPGMFNDIVTGGNQGCGTAGFTAVKGWDPVTGLGTPDYKKMLKVLG